MQKCSDICRRKRYNPDRVREVTRKRRVDNWEKVLNPTKGYYFENCVPCCKVCNIIKGDRLTPEETLGAINAIQKVRLGS